MTSNNSYHKLNEEDLDKVNTATRIILKTLTLNNVPEHVCMVSLAKSIFVLADFNDFDDEDLRHLLTQFYVQYTEKRHKHHEI